MARLKQGIDGTPIWDPNTSTRDKMSKVDYSVRYKAMRNSSTGFVNRPDVRAIVMERCNYKCVKCDSVNNLQVDHIVSVVRACVGDVNIWDVNKIDNLQILCRSCNARKHS